MRKTRTLEESYGMFVLLYLVAHVFAYGLGYFLGNFLFKIEERMPFPLFTLLYVFFFLCTSLRCCWFGQSIWPLTDVELVLIYVFILSGFCCFLLFSEVFVF